MLFFVPIASGPAADGHTYGPFDFFFNVRTRYEMRNDMYFDNASDDEQTLSHVRARFGFDYDTGEDDTRIRVTYQFGWFDEDFSGTNFNGENHNLVEAFAERTWDGGSFRAGRQKVTLGSGSLVGSNEWGEHGRSWNGVRIVDDAWDLFVGRLDFDDGMGIGEHYLGFAGYDWGYGGQTNLIYHWSHWGNPSIYTLNHTYHKDYGNFKLGVEGAWQWGREGGNDLEAWAGAINGKFSVSDRMSIFGGYNTASGGTDTDGTNNTFNDLFPSDHRRNGIMDIVGWRNVNAIHVGVGFQVSEGMRLSATYHDFTLNDSSDGWYAPINGMNVYGSGDGAEGVDDLGSEIDINLMWKLRDNMKLSAGFAVFDPGTYFESAGYGTDNATWFYGSLGWKF